jgi:phytoene/squalene synthetase
MTGEPEISPEAYERFSIYLGTGKADDVANDVRSGEITADEAEAWSRSVEEMHEKSRHRPDIEPEDWRKFEEGWRPEGW